MRKKNNFFFIKYLQTPKRFQERNYQNFIDIIDKEAFMIKNEGEEDNKIVLPYLMTKK